MTKETETLAVLQNESFNFPRYYDSYLMDPWRQYSDSPLQVENCSKSRLTCDEDVTAFSFVCDQYKTLKDQKMMPCNRSSSVYKPPERNPSLTSPELSVLESPTNIMKLLSDTISSAQQEVPDLNKRPPTLCTPRTPAQPEDFIEPSSEIYDKQVINHIFESILLPSQPKWNTSTSPEAVHYTEPFVDQTSPAYSYTNSPPPSYRNEFQFVLGAPQAIQHKPSNIPMVYLNKGQFYPITLNSTGDGILSHSRSKVKVVIMAVFENEKSPELQLKCWNHWHARQPTVKQRVIDIADYKEVFSSISNVEEVAFNALSFIWNTTEEAKVYIGINSLSTDFSSQKGVKGLPLNLQIDTYDFSSGTNRLIHRAACQVKIFCDKGAERKMRDEDRKRAKRRTKNADSSLSTSSSKQSVVSSSVGSDSTYFKSVDDLVAQPVLFIPEMHFTMQRCSLVPGVTSEDSDRCSLKRKTCPPYSEGGQQCGPQACKQPRKEESQRVLLYVRTESEEVFDALMLSTPNLKGLKQAISEKYGMQEEAIGKIYKKCKRGIFVNMDDNIIEHYCNHSAFQLEMTDMLGQYQVTLTEL